MMKKTLEMIYKPHIMSPFRFIVLLWSESAK